MKFHQNLTSNFQLVGNLLTSSNVKTVVKVKERGKISTIKFNYF